MTSSRLKSLSKLALLLGVPVALLLGLFGGGVYCGHEHRAGILAFERDWLGMDVVVPGEPVKPAAPVEPVASTPATPPVVTPTPQPTPQPVPTTQPTQPTQPTPTPAPAALLAVTDPVPLPLAEPLALPADLQARLAEPVRVRVKVLVDAELVDRRPDWIAYAQRHVAWASQVLERQVGVHLDLRGVVVWSVPAGDTAALVADLQNRERDGADLLLGLSSRSFAGATMPEATAQANLGFVVAEANPTSRAPHLRGMLHAIGEAFGAAPVVGPGTFMGDVIAGDQAAIGLDDASRQQILARKGLPFQALPDAAPGQPEDGQPADDEPDADDAPAGDDRSAAGDKPAAGDRPLPGVGDADL